MSLLIWCLIIAASLVVLVPFFGIVYMSYIVENHVRKYDE
jgi:hypothetical protein